MIREDRSWGVWKRYLFACYGIVVSLLLRPVAVFFSVAPSRELFYVVHFCSIVALWPALSLRAGSLGTCRLWLIRAFLASTVAAALPLYWSKLDPEWDDSLPRALMSWMELPALIALLGATVRLDEGRTPGDANGALGYRARPEPTRPPVAEVPYNVLARYLLAVPIMFGLIQKYGWIRGRLHSVEVSLFFAVSAYAFTRSTFSRWRRFVATACCTVPPAIGVLALAARLPPPLPRLLMWAPGACTWVLPWAAVVALVVILTEWPDAPEKFV